MGTSRLALAAAAAAALGVGACDRKAPREAPPSRPTLDPGPPASPAAEPAAAPTPEAAAPAPVAGCTLEARPLRRPMPRRLVAIGDLHGDLAATRAALRLAGAIDAADRWTGGDLVVVQTGDVLDRGDDEQAILDLFARLATEAAAAGGALIMLLGNHELMNAAGDFRYVTARAMSDFDDAPGLDTSKWQAVPELARGRIAALAPGGVYARRLAALDVVTIVGDTVFSHAGVVGAWAAQLDAANQASRCWLDGQAGGPEAAPPAATAADGPTWTRAYGLDDVDCDAARAVLARLGVRRMVVGHTVQARGINSVCDGAVWRIDVGLARAYDGPIQVLELAPTARVLEGARLP